MRLSQYLINFIYLTLVHLMIERSHKIKKTELREIFLSVFSFLYNVVRATLSNPFASKPLYLYRVNFKAKVSLEWEFNNQGAVYRSLYCTCKFNIGRIDIKQSAAHPVVQYNFYGYIWLPLAAYLVTYVKAEDVKSIMIILFQKSFCFFYVCLIVA